MDIQELFDKLPENLQDKIIRMNPHPLTYIFNSHLKDIEDDNVWTKNAFRLTQLRYGHYEITSETLAYNFNRYQNNIYN